MKCWEFCLYEFNIGILKHMFIIDRKKIKVLNFFLCDLIFFNDKYTSHLSQTRSLANMLTSSYYHIVGQITHGLVCLKWQGIWCKYHPLICEVASGSLIKMLVNPNLIMKTLLFQVSSASPGSGMNTTLFCHSSNCSDIVLCPPLIYAASRSPEVGELEKQISR